MRKPLLAAAWLAALAAAAHAQSSPGWSYGQVPTAGQWNAEFAAKQDYLGYAPLNGSGGSMTGKLYLFPSTTSFAGLNFGQGNAPGAPINGDVWMTSQGLFYEANGSIVGPIGTGSGGGATVTFGLQVDAFTIATTNTVPALSKSFNGNYIVALFAGGTYSNAGAAPAFTVSGTTVTWNAANAGFSLASGDNIAFAYTAASVPVVPTLGGGVSAALQTSANAAGGFVTYPVPPSAFSGFGAGVAAALALPVNAANGLPVLSASGALAVPGPVSAVGNVSATGDVSAGRASSLNFISTVNASQYGGL